MATDFDLEPGDVLSYSAGSTQTGPEGYRKLRPRPALIGAAFQRWPELAAPLAGRTPLLINAYPSTVGAVSTGVSVDTYLSPRILSRALQLGAAADKPVLLTGQPLFLADCLLAHIDAERPLPDTILLLVGGYVMPASLERSLRGWLRPRLSSFDILQGYGAAEVDAGCLMARERDAQERPIYHPRPDIVVEIDLDTGELLLSMIEGEGERVVDRFRTGDSAEPSEGGYALWNDTRLHPGVHAALESWSEADWRRRTGYLRREDQGLSIQLRQGHRPARADELDFWDFGRAHGFSWLDKPWWR